MNLPVFYLLIGGVMRACIENKNRRIGLLVDLIQVVTEHYVGKKISLFERRKNEKENTLLVRLFLLVKLETVMVLSAFAGKTVYACIIL